MQDAVGPSQPPGYRAAPGPGTPPAGHWGQSAEQPAPHAHHAGHPPVPPHRPGPPQAPAVPPQHPAPQPPVPGGSPAGAWPGHGYQGPPPQAGEQTGHLALPPGALVDLPSPQPDATVPDVAHAAVAVLLIGPAGAGKTSVARHWADLRRVPTAHISLDDVREWVRAGFADPQAGWNEHSEAQYRLARRTCGFAARNFLANGISCILDDAVFPDRPVVGLGGWKRHVGPGLLPVVLLPGLEIVLERNARRSGNRRLSDEEVARIHGRMAGWYGSGLPIIDNSSHDVATTARMLDEVVARSLASPPSW
ncbi:AAA family ATPase [Streptomyces sp. NPDC059740]|uniref:AAA family ATPase n=1 Tax=Streptomyces sp. NPDC059740 TaxID=3346926 RepID=UPI003654675D